MKKVLFASTALVMTAGVASAEVTLSGSAAMGVVSAAGAAATLYTDYDLDAKSSVTTDGGITFGTSIALENGSSVNGADLTMSVNGLTLTVAAGTGDVDNAGDVAGMADAGLSGLGVDNVFETGAYGTNDVAVSYAFGDITVSASIDSNSANNDYGVGVSGSFGDFSVALGTAETAGVNQTAAKLGYASGDFSGSVHYLKNGAAAATTGLTVGYTSGDMTITGLYVDGATNATGVTVAYDLGGATFTAGVADLAAGTSFDMGVSFSF